MEPVFNDYVKNQYSISIKKCCASCLHHDSKGEDYIRYCKKGMGKRRLDYYCGSGWVMMPGLDNAGRGGGRVKKPQYIQYVREHGPGHAEEYEMQYGSRYLIKR